tara:strand:- start:2073 stop:2285 length:213 start_codon:yes stop_codon:yes gene_type:complete
MWLLVLAPSFMDATNLLSNASMHLSASIVGMHVFYAREELRNAEDEWMRCIIKRLERANKQLAELLRHKQ